MVPAGTFLILAGLHDRAVGNGRALSLVFHARRKIVVKEVGIRDALFRSLQNHKIVLGLLGLRGLAGLPLPAGRRPGGGGCGPPR